MNPFDADPHYAAPPPAYSEQEFDQKVSRAVELSNQASNAISADDEWEHYDPAAFEAAAAAYEAQQKQQTLNPSQQVGGPSTSPIPQPQAQSSQQIQQTQPLRIHKKANSRDLKPKKEQPKWASELNDQGGTSSGSRPPAGPVYNAYDGDDLAPPPFAETAPEPYPTHQGGDAEFDPYAMYPPARAESPAVNQVQPQPPPSNNIHPQPPPSIDIHRQPTPSNNIYPQPPVPDPVHQTVQPSQLYVPDHPTLTHNRQSMPVSPSTPRMHRTDHRPYSDIGPASPALATPQRNFSTKSFSSSGSMLQFNPSVAYGKTPQRHVPHVMPVHEQPSPPQVYNPNAFYNAAVSAHMSTPARTRTVSTYPNSNGYDQPRFANGNVGGFNSPMPGAGGWSPAMRPVSTFSMESSYSDDSGGRMNQYSTPGRPNIEWQHHNYR